MPKERAKVPNVPEHPGALCPRVKENIPALFDLAKEAAIKGNVQSDTEITAEDVSLTLYLGGKDLVLFDDGTYQIFKR